MESILITEDKKEMAAIGKTIVDERTDIYTPLMKEKIMERIRVGMSGNTQEEINTFFYTAVYDYWVYGNNIDEEFFYQFYKKNDKEKKSYMTNRLRTVYMDYLCVGGVPADPVIRKMRIDLLEQKYETYKRLKPYYKRDVIELKDITDFEKFEQFADKHHVFVAKPSNFYWGVGVHKVNINDFASVRDCFESLLKEGIQINERHPSLKSSVVLEELIQQSEGLAVLHPYSINGIRATAVKDQNGKIVVFHPWIKCGVGGEFVASAALGGFDAEIDAKTGIIITDGISENGKVYKVHPDTGITIKGYQIPKWEEMLSFVDELMRQLPEYGYIGWDLVLTDNGWCVMEANYSGEFMWQLIRGTGGKEEFEELIGWKMKADFWWQIRPFQVSEKQPKAKP